jgi:hypothetical protein
MPADVRQIPAAVLARLTWLFTDIDDTLTTSGLLLAESFAALWRLHEAGIRVVPVTGRPAGWCDHIARMWPVAGVIGENGAFAFVYDRQARHMERRWLMDPAELQEGRRRLEGVRRRVLAEVPGTAVAADQSFRTSDLAIDYREDVGPLGPAAVRRICEIALEEGATCKVSSIHVNCWFGTYDKVTGMERLLAESPADSRLTPLARDRGLGGDRGLARNPGLAGDLGEAAFCGDSPNDEPMFARLETTVGVANIRPYLEQLTHPPRYITQAEGGLGFAELAGIILGARLGSGDA